MNLSNNNDKKSKKSGIASLFGRGSVSKIGKSQFPKSMGGIMERLKGLSRKDLALVGVGLSVLVAAPVAEYMMSKPADSANMLTSGFSSRDAQGTSALASLYEPGINALSQGSADGSGEVITPLSARDPYALILGAQPEQPPMQDYSASMPSYSGDTSSSSSSKTTPPDYNDLRDSVKDSAKRGAAKAMETAHTDLSKRLNSGMSMGSRFSNSGGTSTSGKLPNPVKANLNATQRKEVNPKASNGFKGATNTPNSGDSSAADRLRAKANAQGGYFSGASAVKAADSANAIKMNDKLVDGSTGSSYDGTGYGTGNKWGSPNGKGTSNSWNRGSMDCKTLSCKAAEARQKRALDWENYLQLELPKKFIDMGVDAVKNFVSKSAEKLTQMIWNEDVEGVTKYYCLGKIEAKGGCVKGNVKILHSSNKQKTIGGWKDCECSAYVHSEMVEKFGNINEDGSPVEPSGNTKPSGNGGGTANGNGGNGGGANGNGGGSANGNDGNAGGNNPKDDIPAGQAKFDTYVKNYDDALIDLIGQIAAVRAKPTDQKVVEKANAVIDTYTGKLGQKFEEVRNEISKQATSERVHLNTAKSMITNSKSIKSQAEKKAGELDTMLKKMAEHPLAFVKKNADGSETGADVGQLKGYIKDASSKYTTDYVKQLADVNDALNKHEAVINSLNTHIRISEEQVSVKLFGTEYKQQYSAKVNGFKSDLSVAMANDAQKLEAINNFLVNMDKYPIKEAVAAASAANNMHNAVTGIDYPSGKAREWRGLSAKFGEEAKKTEAQLKEETKGIIAKEKTAWVADSPLECKQGCKVKNAIPDANKPQMNDTDFYSPGYRLFVEIPAAIAEESTALTAVYGNAQNLVKILEKIEKDLIDAGFDLAMPDCVKHHNCSTTGADGIKGSDGAETQAIASQKYNSKDWWKGKGLYYDVNPTHMKKVCDNPSDRNKQMCQDYRDKTKEIHEYDRDRLDALDNQIDLKNSNIVTAKKEKDLAKVEKLEKEKAYLSAQKDALQQKEYKDADEATFIGLSICLEAGAGDRCFDQKTITDRYAGRDAAKQAYNSWLQMSPYGADNSSSSPSAPSTGTGNNNNGTSGSNAGSGSTNTDNSSSKCKIPVPPGGECPPDAVINPDTGQHLFTSKANKSVNMEDASNEASSKSVKAEQSENKENVESESKDEEKKKHWWNLLSWFKKDSDKEKAEQENNKKYAIEYGWTIKNFNESLKATTSTSNVSQNKSIPGLASHHYKNPKNHFGENYKFQNPNATSKKGKLNVEAMGDGETIHYRGSVDNVVYGKQKYDFAFDAICEKRVGVCGERQIYNTNANKQMVNQINDKVSLPNLCIKELTIHAPGAEDLVSDFEGTVCQI